MSTVEETVEREALMLRIHARSAEDYIAALTAFVRKVSTAKKLNTYHRDQAKALVCYVDGCIDRPSGHTPDGRSFCGRHAGVMD